MAEDKNKREKSPPPELTEEYRSISTDIAALAMPVAVVTAPVVNAWAKQHFSQEGKPQDPQPPQPSKDD